MADQSKILVVDDDPEIRHLLATLFEIDGFEVVGEASDGVEAVPLALKHEPDFVILDYRMPRMNGPKTAEVLRGIIPEAKIVAFSAMLEAKPAWADAYLNKERIIEMAPLLSAFVAEHN
ncbi:MAG TPA: response regulator transcription factor [Actinomycetota bacterium]|nr:response regulator transcription factor [Actinomycetota bacterium]